MSKDKEFIGDLRWGVIAWLTKWRWEGLLFFECLHGMIFSLGGEQTTILFVLLWNLCFRHVNTWSLHLIWFSHWMNKDTIVFLLAQAIAVATLYVVALSQTSSTPLLVSLRNSESLAFCNSESLALVSSSGWQKGWQQAEEHHRRCLRRGVAGTTRLLDDPKNCVDPKLGWPTCLEPCWNFLKVLCTHTFCPTVSVSYLQFE